MVDLNLSSLLGRLGNIDVVFVRKTYIDKTIIYKLWKPKTLDKNLLSLWLTNSVYETWRYVPEELVRVEVGYAE